MKTRWLAVAIVVSLSASAFGQNNPRVSEILRRGVQLRQQGQDEAALREFQRALRMSPEPRVLAQVALAEQALGRWVEASRHIDAALASQTDPWVQRNRATLEASRTEVEQHVGRLLVTGGVGGAEVVVNGERVATLPMTEAPVLAGTGALEVRAEGYMTVTRPLRIAAGATTRERVSLTAVASPGTPTTFREAVEPPTGATLFEPAEASRVSEEPPEFQRFGIDAGFGLGWAFTEGRPMYAEQRFFTSQSGAQIRSCSGYVCYQTIDPGFASTFYVAVNARYNFTRRIGLGVSARVQFDAANWTIEPTAQERMMGGVARSNPFANLLLTARLYVALNRLGFATTGFNVSAIVGFGGGQIEPKPAIPSNVTGEGAHILSGYLNAQTGVRLEWALARHFHLGIEFVAQFMFPTFLFDLDTTVVTGVHF